MADVGSIAREMFESFNRRDWNKMRSLLHADYTYTGGDGQTQVGPEAGVAVAQMFAAAMSDAKITIKSIVTSGNTAITEFIGSGTQDGEIAAEREYMDMAHLLQQIGAMPAPATA